MSGAIPFKGRIPVTLVTGFLGSGKTTLINVALKAPELSHAVVVVNEFGEVGLDHELYAASRDSVIILENGCLCCTVRSDLVSTLNSLYADREAGRIPGYDRVVVETSGLAEPGPVLQAFLSEPTLDGLYRVSNVITLVDAVNWDATKSHHLESVQQVALADRVLISKLDLAKKGDRERLEGDIRQMNPQATIAEVEWSSAAVAKVLTEDGFDSADPKADPLPWLAVESRLEHHDSGGHGLHLHRRAIDVESFVLLRNEPLSREELQFLLDGISQNLGTGLLRVKGLVNIANEPGRPAVLQGAQHLLHTMSWLEKWPSADERTRIVFITQGIVREMLRDTIELLDRVSARTFAARERARKTREQRA